MGWSGLGELLCAAPIRASYLHCVSASVKLSDGVVPRLPLHSRLVRAAQVDSVQLRCSASAPVVILAQLFCPQDPVAHYPPPLWQTEMSPEARRQLSLGHTLNPGLGRVILVQSSSLLHSILCCECATVYFPVDGL